MTFLETIIRNRTRQTPSGGSYRIGDASISVWYSADTWEWKYLDEIFWDIQDLASALAKGTKSTSTGSTLLSLTSSACCRRCLANRLWAGASLSAGKLTVAEAPVRLAVLASPLTMRLLNYRMVRVFKDPHLHCS
jgi:hypothetical protein